MSNDISFLLFVFHGETRTIGLIQSETTQRSEEIEPVCEGEAETREPVSKMEQSEMIVKNKLTKETLDIPYSEFRKKFAKEIQDAFESYRKTQLNKYSWNFKDDNSLEFNFYFELQWNFNHFGNSNWYIEIL